MSTVVQFALYLVIGAGVLALLPSSPFAMVSDLVASIPFLDILNWFVPVTEMVAIGEAWLLAISAFYIISMILRWLNIIS